MTQKNKESKRVTTLLGCSVISLDELGWNKYRKRPVLMRAVQIDVPFSVLTSEGLMEGRTGDWIIEDTEGELHFCCDSVFRATYEQMETHVDDYIRSLELVLLLAASLTIVVKEFCL